MVTIKPFQFRLDALLKFRRIQEEQAQVSLAQATAKYLAAQEELVRMEDKLADHLAVWRERQQQPVTVGSLKMFQDYNDKLICDITRQQQSVAAAESFRQECIHNLEEAAKARKVVEKLREKRLRQYRAELLREEQKELDELGLQAFVRN